MNDIPAIVLSSLRGAPWGWGLFVTVLVALIKAWPILAKQAIDASAKLRQEKREDLNDCHRRLDQQEREFNALKDEFTNLKIEMNATLSAYRILDAELEVSNPNSLGLRQARMILSTAFTIAPSTTGPSKTA